MDEVRHAGDGVHHVTVGDDGCYALRDAQPGLIVFWWNDRPVGHAWAPAEGSVEGRIAPDVMAAVRAEESSSRAPTHAVSVLICTRDRPDDLRRCLASLPRQSYPPREVIVVDNASRDARTREVAVAAGATYAREERPGLDFARNTAVSLATSDIVAFTDDDVLLHPRWLERLVAAFDRPEVACVTGLVLPGELATEAQRHFERYWSFGRGYVRRDFAARFADQAHRLFPAWDVGAGASMAIRRDAFDQVGLFDERLGAGAAGCSDDSEFWYRLLAHGNECRYEPRSVVFHFHRRTIEGLASQIYQYMRGHAAALLVQHERTGIAMNLRQALWRTPRWYADRVWNRVRGHRNPQDRFLKEEVLGYLSGLLFYLRNRREGP